MSSCEKYDHSPACKQEYEQNVTALTKMAQDGLLTPEQLQQQMAKVERDYKNCLGK